MASIQDSAVQSLLARAHSPDSAKRIYAEKIQHRPILLRPSSPTPADDARDARRQARRRKEKQRAKALKPKPLSSRQRRQMCLYDVPREGQKYALFEPLHRLWLGYVREILGSDLYIGGPGAAAKLSSADFHGAEVEVARSGCVSRVGIKGIVIKDSKFAFEIITSRNKLKLVPKEGTIFRVEIPAVAAEDGTAGSNNQTPRAEADSAKMIFEVLGDQFLYRSADRASKKFKAHFLESI